MKRIILTSLLMVTGLTSQAQPHEYAKSMGILISRPQVEKDQKTNKTTAKWYATNMAWIKDYCEVENVATEKDILKIFPELPNLPDYGSYLPMSWRLTSENNETVLHCYFQMPADEVTDMWLASEETCIVDQETGAQYRIRRTEPDTYRKHFTLKAKAGDVVDLKVFFAPLAETTKEVRIYGLPNWGMMGGPIAPVTIRHEAFGTFEPLAFDTIPQLHKPIVHKEHMSEDKPYDMQNWNTWKVRRQTLRYAELEHLEGDEGSTSDQTAGRWNDGSMAYTRGHLSCHWLRTKLDYRVLEFRSRH